MLKVWAAAPAEADHATETAPYAAMNGTASKAQWAADGIQAIHPPAVNQTASAKDARTALIRTTV